ncbi:MAG: hypothetical protein Ct9H300mP11_27700 [Chloroflexota bacterium]|nr:MAG: hypothetical protein Ct9H300mP11_27700 [Chloroflexota bacterium]
MHSYGGSGAHVAFSVAAPRRVSNGVDYNRLLMLAAVASRRSGLEIAGQDIITNVAGGFKINETAADLPLVLAMASSLYNVPLDSELFAFGEIGLSGENWGPFLKRNVGLLKLEGWD